MPNLSVMLKPSSSGCNMSCVYCFYRDEAAERKTPARGFMSEETLRNIIRRTLPRTGRAITYLFQGGEPTLRGLGFYQKAVELERRCNTRGVRVFNSIQTNGYLIDENWCRFLGGSDFLVGLSVDGIRAVHDALRPGADSGPTYGRVLRAAEIMDACGVKYNILTVVTKQAAANIDEIYDFYRLRGWKYQQYIPCLEPLGARRGVSPYALTPEEYGDFLIRLFSLWYRDFGRGSQPYIRQFENYIGILCGRAPEACDQTGVCSLQYVAEADGSVYPCDFYASDDWLIGNFNSDRLDAIDAAREASGFIGRSRLLSAKCRECEFFALCRGGCQRNREFDPAAGTYSNYFCEGYRKFFAACRSRLVRAADAVRGANRV
jgi:uncharacterized protein